MNNEKKKLNIICGRAAHSVQLADVIYMEKKLRKIELHSKRGDIVFYGRFADLIPQLDERFCHCHKSYILNMDEVIRVASGCIAMSDESILVFGKNLYGNFRNKYREYIAGQSRKNA